MSGVGRPENTAALGPTDDCSVSDGATNSASVERRAALEAAYALQPGT